MDTHDAQRIIEMQGRRAIVRAIDLPHYLRKDGTVLLGGREENGDTVRIDYIGDDGMFGIFVEGVLTATTSNLMSFFIPKYVLAKNTEVAVAQMLVEAGISFTLTDVRS